jgi:D-alanine-D-alanine ligase-like ATP-grasp enzyme
MADEGIENRTNSFELYGFDFVVDDQLDPWLLEANMSPACAER